MRTSGGTNSDKPFWLRPNWKLVQMTKASFVTVVGCNLFVLHLKVIVGQFKSHQEPSTSHRGHPSQSRFDSLDVHLGHSRKWAKRWYVVLYYHGNIFIFCRLLRGPLYECHAQQHDIHDIWQWEKNNNWAISSHVALYNQVNILWINQSELNKAVY